MLSQEPDDGVDAMVLGATDHFASNLFLCDEARTNQPAQMKRQGGCRQVKASLYFADVQSTRTGANQKPVDVEAGQVAQFGEAACGEFSVHKALISLKRGNYNYKTGFMAYHAPLTTYFDISRNIVDLGNKLGYIGPMKIDDAAAHLE